MGHKATTCCMVIANRLIKEANTGYKSTIDNLITEVLDRI
jgi:uridine phosphorylase